MIQSNQPAISLNQQLKQARAMPTMQDNLQTITHVKQRDMIRRMQNARMSGDSERAKNAVMHASTVTARHTVSPLVRKKTAREFGNG